MPARSEAEHEALCRRCGRCCYEKLIVEDHVFTLRKPCKFFDETTRLCRVYARRHEVNPRCLTVAEGIRLGVFPADCPYVREVPGYRPAVDGWLDEAILEKIERGVLCRAEDVLAEMRRREKAR